MSWFKSTPKKPLGPVSEEVNPQVSNYPKSNYSVYWEKLIDRDHNGNERPGIGVVRFYKYDGRLDSYSTFEAPDLENKLNAHIVHQMETYRK